MLTVLNIDQYILCTYKKPSIIFTFTHIVRTPFGANEHIKEFFIPTFFNKYNYQMDYVDLAD